MGSFYSGFGGHKSYLGHCEDGVIYSGNGNSTPIGRYENGNIYNQFREHAGSYNSGSIYDSCGKHIASYDNGVVYNQYLNATVGKEQIGSYDSNPAEAAALVLLFIGNSTTDYEKRNENTIVSTTDSNLGCLSSIFALLWGIISFLFVVIIPFIFVYWIIPVNILSLPLVGCILMVIFIPLALIGFTPMLVLAGIIGYAFYILFIPYYICTIAIKIKTKCSRTEMLKLFWKWFLKGPLAYPNLVEIMASNNVMPKTTQLLNKIIGFVSQKFKKTSV